MEQFVPTQLAAIQLMCMSICNQLAQHVLPVLTHRFLCWRLVIFERYLGCQFAAFSTRYGPFHLKGMVGQTDFSGRLIESKQVLLIDFYESWHAQNTQKHDMARKWTRVLHAHRSKFSAHRASMTNARKRCPSSTRGANHKACRTASRLSNRERVRTTHKHA